MPYVWEDETEPEIETNMCAAYRFGWLNDRDHEFGIILEDLHGNKIMLAMRPDEWLRKVCDASREIIAGQWDVPRRGE